MDLAGRPPPTTFEAIEAIALRQPQRLALVEAPHRWTYGQFYLALLRFSRLLADLGIRRGERVAVSQPGFALTLLLLIGCENVGAVSAVFDAEGDDDAATLFTLADWVLSEKPQPDAPARVRFQLLDQSFADRAAAIDPSDVQAQPRVALRLDEPQRITRTSGSSGHCKFMLLARQAQETWVRAGAENGGYDATTRLLVGAPLVINAAFARSCACLRLGAAVLAPAGLDVQREELTHVLALPLRLAQLLDELPAGYAPHRPVQVGTIGGFVPPDLRARAERVFGRRVLSRYGTNEVCGVCEDLDASGTGLLSAGVDVRILDAEGNELPAGETGIIAIRTPGMTDGYLNDPEASASAFRDGWFHSGDLGALVGPRLLRLAGRHDDLINIGGLKVPASQLEQAIRLLDGVRDCAVLTLNLDQGAATLGIALVGDAGAPAAELAAQLQADLPIPGGVVAELLWVDELPRLPSGKLDRMGLLRLFKRQLSVKV